MAKVDQRKRPPKVTQLYGARIRVERLCDVANFQNTQIEIDASVFLAAKTADSIFTTCFIVDQALTGADTEKPNQLKQVFETLTDTLVDEVAPLTDYELNGLKRTTRQLIAHTGTVTSAFVVGTQTYGTSPTQYLASAKIEDDGFKTTAKATYLQPGIVDAEKKSDSDAGLLYVTFRSWHTKVVPTCLKSGSSLNDDPTVAFQGGSAAQIYRDRIENVKGFRTYTVTVMMKIDGTALVAGADQLVNSYNKYIKYTRPGLLSIDATAGNALAWGFVGEPGAEKEPLALVQEYISTVPTLDGTFAPFSVTAWASGFLSVIQDGEPAVASKSAHGYLGGASGSATGNPTYSYSISSTPSMASFLALTNTVVASSNGPAFVTDEGVRWYKKTRISIPGNLGGALS
jgi:hypothetical protein